MALTIGTAILSATSIGSIGVGLGTLATSTIAGISTATIVGDVALTGVLFGVQALVNATGDRLKTTVNIKQALAPRVRIYGRTMVAGVKSFEQVRNGNLYQTLMLASDRIDGVEGYYIGDVGVAVVNGLVQTAPWSRSGGSSYIGFDVHLGAKDQAAAGLVQGAFPETGNFALNGIAYVGVVMLGTKADQFQKTYPQGQDTLFRFVVRGALVFDPRSGTTAWSANAALCIRDFLTHPDGLNLPAAMIDDDSFKAFADVCDQAVPLKAGGTEPRYAINGTYDLSELPKDVLARLCACCDGQLVVKSVGGRLKVGITGGVWVAPTVSLTSDHVFEGGFDQGSGAFDAYNRLTASFSYGSAYYQMTEIAPLQDRASQAVAGVIPQTLALPMVTSYSQAARLAKIAMAKANPAWRGQVALDMTGLDAVGELTVNLAYAPVQYAAPLVSTSFLVTSLTLGADLASVEIGVSSLTADAYAWNPATEEPDAPRTPYAIADINNVAPPANAQAAISDGVGYLNWDAPTRPDATASARYQVSGSGQWQAMTMGDGQSAFVTGLSKGTSYDFEVAFTAGGATSAQSVVANVSEPLPPPPDPAPTA